MTESQWDVCDDVLQLLQHEQVYKQRRKMRLFGSACCRQLDQWLSDERLLKALDATERYADGLIKEGALRKWERGADQARDEIKHPPGQTFFSPEWITCHAVCCASTSDRYAGWGMVAQQILKNERTFGTEFHKALRIRLLALLHDIFGNPFRPVAFSAEWRTDTAVSLARGMYESRDFSAMPILADALQDADCDNDDVLNHCREANQVHVRGCWVVDLVLGKA